MELEYIHRICVPTSVAHGNEGSTVDEACFDGATTGDDVFFRNWTNGDTTSPSCGIGDLGAGRERSVVRTADSTGESLIMLEIHLHAITSLILDVNGEQLPVVVGLGSTLVLEVWSRRRRGWNAPEGSGRNAFTASNVLEIGVSTYDHMDEVTFKRYCFGLKMECLCVVLSSGRLEVLQYEDRQKQKDRQSFWLDLQ